MRNKSLAFVALGLCVVFSMGETVCPNQILVSRTVTVPSGGGGVDVDFVVSAGDQVYITLTGTSPMEPYGYLGYPGGSGEYAPQNGTAQNGVNSATVTLNETGTFTLTIYDGTNQGGQVQVVIKLVL